MTLRQTDNSTFWRAVQHHLRARIKDNYGITPMVPASIMKLIAERIWERRRGK